MELYAYLTARSVTGVSRYCIDFMRKFKSRDYNIIPPAIEKVSKTINKNKYRAAFGFKKDELLCIFVGGGGKRKGLDTAINTINKIDNDKIKLLIVGPGKMPKVNKNCKFFGRVDKKTLERLYAISDILFFPSRYEGFPTVIPEAMAFGTVPLVYNKKPFNEIANNRNSFLVDNSDEFSHILSRLINNREDLLKRRKKVLLKQKNSWLKICSLNTQKFLIVERFYNFPIWFVTVLKYYKFWKKLMLIKNIKQ